MATLTITRGLPWSGKTTWATVQPHAVRVVYWRHAKGLRRQEGDLRRGGAASLKPIAVFDDRNQVVRMWRDLGLTVFQVADGNF